MARTMEHVATINSLARTILAAVLMGAIGFASWLGYRTYNAADIEARKRTEELETARQELAERDELIRRKQQEIGELNVAIQEKDEKIAQLHTAMRLLKMDHRVAHLEVLEQKTDPESGQLTTSVSFVEVNNEGSPIGEVQTFDLEGDMAYIDHWVVKFDDKYVEEAEIDRGTSIVLFRRIFGEYQQPSEGYIIDDVGSRPTSYVRGGQMSEFEKKIWDDFWNIANNPAKAAELGIRAAHGDATYTKLTPGKRYEIQLRASDGLSIRPLPEEKKPPQS